MDNFFELIPLILVGLYYIFGSGKKNKKSPNPATSRPKMPPKTPPRRSIEDILKELNSEFEGRTAPVPQPVKTAPRAEKKPEKKPEKVKLAEPYSDTIVHRAETGRSMAEIREEIKREKHIVDEEYEMEFDLKQAIINDAILNRPYQ